MRRPPKKFLVSAVLAGIPFLGLTGLLLAASLQKTPRLPSAVDYLLVALILGSWIYYVQRPKTARQMLWNSVYLVAFTGALTVVAYALKPTEIGTVLLYWVLAVLSTAGIPLIIALTVLAIHQFVCARAAAEVGQSSRSSGEGDA